MCNRFCKGQDVCSIEIKNTLKSMDGLVIQRQLDFWDDLIVYYTSSRYVAAWSTAISLESVSEAISAF